MDSCKTSGNPNPIRHVEPFKKGNPGGPGRPKGIKNRQHLMMMTLSIMSEGEWQKWLLKMKEKEPKAFMAFMAHLLPRQATVELTVPSFTNCLRILEAKAAGLPVPPGVLDAVSDGPDVKPDDGAGETSASEVP